MKPNPPLSYKLRLFYVAVCAVLVALSQSASAARAALPPDHVSVPDGGATVLLLGAAVGALGIARRYLKR